MSATEANEASIVGDHPPLQGSTAHADDVRAVYSENGQVTRAMWEWRHKVLTLYVASLAGVASAFLWLAEHEALDTLWIPFAFGGWAATVLVLMDLTNARTLKSCYRVGDVVERTIVGPEGAIYAALYARSKDTRSLTYGRLLLAVYALTGVAMFVAAIWCKSWASKL